LSSDSVDTPLVEKSKLDEDLQGKPVDATLYSGMIRSLMNLTSSRPDLTYAVCLCTRYQTKPIEKHLNLVKWIFRYLKGTINMGLWYSKDTDYGFNSIRFLCTMTIKEQLLFAATLFNFQAHRCTVPFYKGASRDGIMKLYFIKEKVENGIMELYFVRME
nr:retrovirus-related Pol polyprotein from transposon TNT 1-94 [Tanacetum cinerariifolium]